MSGIILVETVYNIKKRAERGEIIMFRIPRHIALQWYQKQDVTLGG